MFSFSAKSQLNGTKNIPGDFPTMAAAITALNTQGVGVGGVTLNWIAGNTEIAPAGGYMLGSTLLNASTSASKTITISGNGNTINANAGTGAADAIFNINGVDYLTINSVKFLESASNVTAVTEMEYGVALINLNATAPLDGCQNDVIQNCTVTLNRTNTNSTDGIYSSHVVANSVTPLTVTSLTDAHSNNKYYGNTISNCISAFYLLGYSDAVAPYTYYDQNNDVGGTSALTGNTVSNVGGNAGWHTYVTYFVNQNLGNVSYNTINNAAVTNTTGFAGVYTYGTNSTFTVNNNTITAIQAPVSATYFTYALYANALGTTITANNNNINVTETSGLASPVYGMYYPNGTVFTATTNTVTATVGVAATTSYGIYCTSPTITANNNNVTKTYTSTGTNYGMYLSGATTSTATGNTVTESNSSTGTNYGLYQAAAGISITNSNTVTTATSGSATMYGIYVSSALTPTINSNLVDMSATGTSSGTVAWIYCSATSTNALTLQNNILKTTNGLVTTGSTYLIYGNNSTPNSTISGNRTSGTINRTGASGTFYGYYNFGSPGSGTTTISGNNFSNINITGSTGFYGIYQATSTSQIEIFSFDTVSNVTMGTGTAYTLHHNYGAAGSIVNNCYVSGISGTGTIYGISLGYTTSSGGLNVYNNLIKTLSTTGSSIYGIYYYSGTSTNIYKNKIYDIQSNNAAGVAYGIGLVSSPGVVNVYNNYIGDIRAIITSSTADAVDGIYLGASSGTANVYYNTVYLNGTSTGTNFSNSCIYHNTGATLNLINNILVNLSTPTGTGIVSAQRRSSTSLTTFALTSNNNLLYAGTPSATHAIMYDGTNIYQTLATYKTAIAPRGTASVTESPIFASIVGSATNYLHFNTGTQTAAESGGTAIAGITDDYDGDIRQGNVGYVGGGTAPDMGADEFNGTSPAPTLNSISSNLTGNKCVATARIITANTTAGLAPITSVTLNYSYNGVAQTPITMTGGTFTGTSNWTGTIPAATPVNATVTWNVVVTDGTYTKTLTGTSYQDAYLTGVVATAVGTPTTLCQGSTSVLSLSIPGSGVVGAGALTTTGSASGSYISPYAHFYGGFKGQYLIRASELIAGGVTAGSLTSLGINVTSVGTVYTGFAINMLQTTNTDMSGGLNNGVYTTVYTNDATPVVGPNTYTFTTPFTWDGTSNIIVQICWSDNNGGGAAAEVLYDNPGYVSEAYYRADNQTVSAECSATVGSGTTSSRPQMTFNEQKSLNAYSIVWSNGGGSGSPVTVTPPLGTTNYAATLTDANTCTITSNTVPVTANQVPTASITPAGPTTICGTNLTLTANTNVGNAYLWYLNGTATAITTATLSATTSGSYSVKITNNPSGCNLTSANSVVTINPIPTASITTAGGVTTICGTSLALTANTDIGDTYQWILNGGNVGTNSPNYTATTSGTYTVKITKASTGCNITSTAVVITINPVPTASITTPGGVTTICGTSLVLTENTDIGDSYQWMLNGSNVGTSTTTYTATLSGTYTVKITKLSTGCNITSAPVVITINPIPTSSISTAGNVTTICGTSLALTANTDIGDTYQWMLNGGNVGTNSPNYTATATGTYTVKITNSATGCNSTSAPVVITINPIPTATIATAGNATQFCRTLLITGTTDIGDKFQWYKDGSVIPSATLSTYTASASGSYYLLVTKLATGCNATSATVVITKNTIPSSYITSALTASCSCITLNANTDINPIGNAQYNWYLNGTSVGGNTATYSACVSGTYTLRMTNTPTGCDSLSLPIVITIYPAVTASISPNTATSACVSQLLTTTTNITPAGNARYQWYNASGAIAGATLAAYTATVTGVYHVVDSNNVTGCYQPSNTVSITINAIPTSAITTPGNITTNCVSLVLTDVTNIGTSWQWYKNGTGAGNIIAGANAQTYTATSTGTYYCKAIGIAPTFCNQFSAGVSITINPAPNLVVNVGGPTTFCSGGSVSFTASAGYTYQWMLSNIPIPGATILSYTATQAGNYKLIESTGFCIDTTTGTNVTVNPLPDVSFTLSGPATFCENSSIDLTAISGYTYVWKLNGATVGNAQTYTASQSGSYNLTATTPSGCSKTSPNTVITTIPVPLNTVTLSGPPVFCLGSSVTLTADQTGDDYQWLVNGVNVPGATNQSYTQNNSGSVTVMITGGICSDTSTPIPVVMASPVTTVTYTGSTTFCDGNTLDLTAGAGYVYQWDSAGIMIPGAINQVLTVGAAGDYKVILANLGCIDSSSNVHITVDSTPVPIILRNNTTFTTQAVYTTYQWFKNGIVIPGATNRNYVATINANYTVFVKDGNSCTATSAIATLDGLSVTNTSEVPVSIYPNPATTTIYIQSQAKLNAYIYSIEGKLIMSKDKATELDLHGLANGTYLIKLTDENGNMVKTARITKSE